VLQCWCSVVAACCQTRFRLVTVCCSVLQCCCSVLQCCCSVVAVWLQDSISLSSCQYRYGTSQRVAAFYSVLQCVAILLQNVALLLQCCCSVFALCCKTRFCIATAITDTGHGSVLQRVAVCCSVLQYFAACCSVLQCVAVCCSVLQRAA